jgi:hypothetical protein
MSGYNAVFGSVFKGSLCGKYPDLPVWLVLLAMADKNGEIDALPSFIAMVSGIPESDITAAIARFCDPDPASRTPDNAGRRLEPIPGRGFGWRILNHGLYREKARKAMRQVEETASGRDAARKREERAAKSVRRSPAKSGESSGIRLSDTDTDTDTRKKKKALTRQEEEAPKYGPTPDGGWDYGQ